MKITSSVLEREPPRFDLVGKVLNCTLIITQQHISKGLVSRLVAYAVKRMELSGFGVFINSGNVEVYTIDVNLKSSDRHYVVRFTSAQGGYIELVGILTKNGWPTLDHGFGIGEQ